MPAHSPTPPRPAHAATVSPTHAAALVSASAANASPSKLPGTSLSPYLLPGLGIVASVAVATVWLTRRQRSRASIVPHTLAAQAAVESPTASQVTREDPPPLFSLPSMADAAPKLGHYEIVGRIGSGGAAVTYKAFDTVLRRDVAIKVLHHHLRDTTAVDRLMREARALARLRHRAIPRVLEVLQLREEGTLALIEEYIEGESLSHVIEERGALPLADALPIIRTVADALDHAHRHGIIHHDIKPANVCVAAEHAYLLDFGVAVLSGDSVQLTSQNSALGTPAYMSPEQIEGQRGDVRSDVYLLGVVLYEMLTGQRPFEADTPTAVCMMHLNTPAPEQPLDNLPRPVQAVVKKALLKLPEQRYQSAGELADALERAAGEGTEDEATSSPVRIYTPLVVVEQKQPEAVPLLLRPDAEGDASRIIARDKAGGALHIYAFGEGRVIHDGHAVHSSEWKGLLNKELFFYILLHGPLRRDAISVVFWPNSPPQKVRNSFSTAIRHIRDALGDKDAVMVEKVEGQQGLYWIKEDRWFDVDEFEALIEMARRLPPGGQAANLWERAANLYQGDFLPEAEREWCVSVRARLWEMYFDSLVQVGQHHEAQRDFDQAIRWYKQALGEEDHREDVHRGLIRCYLGAGRRHEALSQYWRCEKKLREARLDPSPETRALYEQIVGKR